MSSAIFDLVSTHFDKNFKELSVLGTTYEVFGDGEGYTAVAFYEIDGHRAIIVHNSSLYDVCATIAREIELDVYRALNKQLKAEA